MDKAISCHAQHLLKTPLHVNMLAQIALPYWMNNQSVQAISQLHTSFELFQTFVHKTITQDPNFAEAPHNISELFKQCYMMFYSQIALQTLKPKLATLLQSSQLYNPLHIIPQTSLTTRQHQTLSFTHQCFLEYFIAHLIDQVLGLKKPPHSLKKQLIMLALEDEHANTRLFLEQNHSGRWHAYLNNIMIKTSKTGWLLLNESISNPKPQSAAINPALVIRHGKLAYQKASLFQPLNEHLERISPLLHALDGSSLSIRQRKTCMTLCLEYAISTRFNLIKNELLKHFSHEVFLIKQIQILQHKDALRLNDFINLMTNKAMLISPSYGCSRAIDYTRQICMEYKRKLLSHLQNILTSLITPDNQLSTIQLCYKYEITQVYPHTLTLRLFSNWELQTKQSKRMILSFIERNISTPTIQQAFLNHLHNNPGIIGKHDLRLKSILCQIIGHNKHPHEIHMWQEHIFDRIDQLLWAENQGIDFAIKIGRLTEYTCHEFLANIQSPQNGFHAIYINKIINRLLPRLFEKAKSISDKVLLVKFTQSVLLALDKLNSIQATDHLSVDKVTFDQLFKACMFLAKDKTHHALVKKAISTLQSMTNLKILFFQETKEAILFNTRTHEELILTAPTQIKSIFKAR